MSDEDRLSEAREAAIALGMPTTVKSASAPALVPASKPDPLVQLSVLKACMDEVMHGIKQRDERIYKLEKRLAEQEKILSLKGLDSALTAIRLHEDRLKTIEASPFRYEGIYKAGATYRKGSFVTHGGAMWHAKQDTQQAPGSSGSLDWTLAVKQGRDALR